MSRYSKLMTRIESGEQVFIDGATGTEIERRGVPQLDNAWNGGGALSHPEILHEVHADYIRAGVDIVIYANHLIRSAYPAMLETAESILQHGRSYEANDLTMSIKEILELIPGAK